MESCPRSQNFISQSLSEYTHLTKSFFCKTLVLSVIFPYLPTPTHIHRIWGHVWGRFQYFRISMPPIESLVALRSRKHDSY